MRYISFTFDDGRNDNYDIAYPIMKKYGYCGTVYCTTGYIDGSWQKRADWISTKKPLTVDQLKELEENGWEIALHGDKHITQKEDLETALAKLKSWGFDYEKTGFSIPDSRTGESEIKRITQSELGDKIAYIRRGRAIDTGKLSSKVLFALYTYAKMGFAYKRFNLPNLLDMGNPDKTNIPSVVVRFKDKPEMLSSLIDVMPDNTALVLMLHSIWRKEDELYGSDPWNWGADEMEEFCKLLSEKCDNGFCEVRCLRDIIL